jgi:exopolysaccharide production protein ExoQ
MEDPGHGDFIQTPDAIKASGNLLRQIAFSALGLFSLIALLRARWRIVNSTTGVLLTICSTWACLSMFWSVDPIRGLHRMILWVAIALCALWLAGTRPGELPRFVVFSSAVFMGTGFLAENVLGSFHPFSPEYRFAGTFHPNHQAINAALLFCAATSLARYHGRYRRALFWTAGIAMLFLLLTKSRTALFSLIATQLVLWVTGVLRLPKRIITAIVSTGLVSVFLFTLLFSPASIRSGLLLNRDTNADTMTVRYELWTGLTPYVFARPLTGYGFGSFWTPEHISDFAASQGWNVTEAHSGYLEILLALGFPGLLLFSAALTSLWIAARREATRNASAMFTVAIVTFAIFNSLTESAAYGAPEFVFLLFWGAAQLLIRPNCCHRAINGLKRASDGNGESVRLSEEVATSAY